MVRRDKTNYLIQSVAHALDVLEQFSGEHDELGVTELSRRLKLHKNNVFRLLATLEARGYIEQNKATENYRLGIRCLQLGRNYIEQLGLVRQARPILTDLANRSRESAMVAVARRQGMVVIEAAEPPKLVVKIAPLIGEYLPFHCTAVGKVHLAYEPEEQVNSQLGEHLQRYTERTIVERTLLLEQLASIAQQGYAVEIGEYLEEVASIAVPVRDYTRSVVAALALAGPAYRLSPERINQELTKLVVKAGRDLSEKLGYEP